MLKVSSKDDESSSAPQIPEIPTNDSPSIEGDMSQDLPDVGEDLGNDGNIPEIPDTEEENDDSTMSIINQLSDEDKESVRAYAESMLNRNNNSEDSESEAPNMEEEMPQENFQEGRRFTKKELKEEFGPKTNSENDYPTNQDKKRTNVKNGNPFNPPKFN